MKKPISNFLQNKKSQKLFILALFIFSFCFINSQPVTINLPQNILHPESGGTLVYDILYANGKIFVYSPDGISIYDEANNNQFLDKIHFDETDLFYGKYNPIYFNPRLKAPDQNLMVYNNEAVNKYIYVLTPKLKLLTINTNNISENWITSILIDKNSEELLDQVLQSQNGRSIIRYDNDNDRLYILVGGRDTDNNCTGDFHSRKAIFCIYNIDNNFLPIVNNYFNLQYSEINGGDDFYGNQINNYVFNEENDYFYIVKLGTKIPISKAIIEIREITTNGSSYIDSFDFVNIDGGGWFKMGKILYINEGDIHKIVILPYRYPSGLVPNPRFCVIDGDDYNNVKYVSSPSKRILDAVYLGVNQDMVLCYAPDANEVVGGEYQNTNTAVFHYFSNTFVATDDNFDEDYSIKTSDFDINSSVYITKLNGSTAFISKKDGVAKLEFNTNNNTYNYSSELVAESNFFNKGISEGGKTYINNTVANGLEIFNGAQHSSIRTAYPVYNIIPNSDGSKLYCFNKLNSYKTGLYVYNDNGTIVNINDQQSNPEEKIETAIGDCIYNPYTDQFLVSENSDFGTGASTKIKVFNTDQNNSWNSTISLPVNTQYAKKMFIAPNEKLYIMANMHYDPTIKPKVFVYSANDYSLLESHELTIPVFNDTSVFYSAHFCYNPHNQTVYATIHPTEITLDPYHTVPNSMFDIDPPVDTDENGLLIKFEENQIVTEQLIFPGKIIFPDIGNPEITSQYDGKMFIIGKKFYSYDYELDQIDAPLDGYDESFNDITYSPSQDIVFAIKDIEDECHQDRKAGIYSIDYDNNSNIVFTNLSESNNMYINGQVSCIFNNPYDGKVYIYNKIDDEKLGSAEAKLFYFDPNNTFSLESIDLGITSFYPELDHNSDYKYFFYNITSPYINPYTNHIYLPNGGHISISKISFNANESLLLNNGSWSWLSFPRLNRNGNNPVLVNTVLSGNIEPGTYSDESELKNLPPEELLTISNIYDGSFWPSNEELTNIQSTLGYKLKLLYDDPQPESKWLHLAGDVLDPETPVSVYENYDNWVGYWLYESQCPFDAIPDDVLEELTTIKGQGWCCVKELQYIEGQPEYIWVCAVHQGDVSLDYGDMVILKSDIDISFQWQRYGNPPLGEEKSATEYYQYNEQADYTSFFIELDSTANPQEIGAFIGDSCIGASTVLISDTNVLVPGYIEGMSGELTFEEYYDSLKSKKAAIKEYFVNNNKTGTWDKRTINTNERRDYYLISFKKRKKTIKEILNNPVSISCSPNPLRSSSLINYYIPEKSMLKISVYDFYGRELNVLYNGESKSGDFNIQWNATDSKGKKLPNGIYIIKLKAGKYQAQTKIIVMK